MTIRTIARVDSHGVGGGAAAGALTHGRFGAARPDPALRYTGPSSDDGSAVTPTRPGPVCVPMTGPISETNSGSRP